MEDEQVSLSPSGQPVANFLTLSIPLPEALSISRNNIDIGIIKCVQFDVMAKLENNQRCIAT